MDLDNVIQEKLDADVDFAAELELLSEEEKAQAITDKKAELTKVEFANLSEEKRKIEEIAADRKIRAEKAEQAAKVVKPAEGAKPSNDDLSAKDLYALMEAKVPQEDIDEVTKAAKVLNVPLAEALKSPIVKGILSTKAEERKTAEVTNTGGGRRAVSKNTDADLLARAERNEMPESDDEIKRLSEARLAARIAAVNNKS